MGAGAPVLPRAEQGRGGLMLGYFILAVLGGLVAILVWEIAVRFVLWLLWSDE